MMSPRSELDGFVYERGEGWIVDGQCTMYDFLSHFDMDSEMQDYEYTTVAGLILNELEHIPEPGENVSWRCFSFEVVDMDGPRIDKVIVKLSEPENCLVEGVPASVKKRIDQ